MECVLIRDHNGLGRKKGDTIQCTQAEYNSLVERGYFADPDAPKTKKAKEDGASG